MELYHVIESHEKIAFDANVKFYLKMLYIADFQLAGNGRKCPEPLNLVTKYPMYVHTFPFKYQLLLIVPTAIRSCP